jgi:hypothetical protein
LLAGNWSVDKHVRYVCDLRKQGYVDIIGFGDAGVLVSLNNGNGTYAPAELVLNDLGSKLGGGWKSTSGSCRTLMAMGALIS